MRRSRVKEPEGKIKHFFITPCLFKNDLVPGSRKIVVQQPVLDATWQHETWFENGQVKFEQNFKIFRLRRSEYAKFLGIPPIDSKNFL